MSTIATIRPYTKPSLPTLTDDSAIVTDAAATGVRSTKWSDFRTQLSGLYPLRTERNAANGHAGIAADGLIDASILRAALVPEEVANDAAKDALVIVAGDIGRRLVRVTASGINYLAKATGSGADKWIAYNSTPAATEAVAGVAEIATQGEADAELDDARFITALKLAARQRKYVDPLVAARAPIESVLYSDGGTADRQIRYELTAAANVAGSPLTEGGWLIRVPTANPALNIDLFTYSDATYAGSAQANILRALLLAGGDLQLQQYGATTADFRTITFGGFRSAYSGRLIRLDAVFTPGSTAPVLYVDGVAIAGTPATGGTPPDWAPPTLLSTRRTCGYRFTAGEWVSGTPINRALSAAQVLTMAQTNALLPVDRPGGSCVELIPQTAGAWSSFGSGTTTTTAYDLAADPDGVGIPAGATSASFAIKIVRTGSSGQGGAFVQNLLNGNYKGSPIKLSAFAKQVSGAAGVTLNVSDGGQVIMGTAVDFGVSTGSGWEALDNLATKTAATGSVGPCFISSSDFVAYVVLPSAKAQGALLQSEITRTAQVLDHGPNRIRGIATAGVRPLTTRPPVGIRGNITATGNILGLGASDPLWFEPGLIREIRVKPTANAATTITYRLNTSGGTVIGTVVTSVLNQWVTLPFSAGAAFEVTSGDKIHITTDAAHDFEIDWARR